MGDSNFAPTRRLATFGDRVWIALFGASVLVAWYRLPLLGPDFSWTHATDRGLSSHFASFGTELSWLSEWLLLVFALLCFQTAMRRCEVSRLRLTRPLFGVVSALVLMPIVSSIAGGLSVRAVLVPVALGSLWVGASFGFGAALLTIFSSLALCALSGLEGVLSPALLVRAIALIIILREGMGARDAIRAGLISGMLSAAVETSSSLDGASSLRALGSAAVLHCSGGILEGVLFAMTRGAGERLLGHASRERLVALLDLSQPLLQRMIHRAPGSFEHSRAMANLAEQAASAIGADALLTRVGAYYHDLGKSFEAKFFVENLDAGESSPHEGLTPQESAEHIVRHVGEGVRLLRSKGIPEAVVEFAYTHHGSQLVEYFLEKERQRCRSESSELCVQSFRYPGMKPGTKETAILMVVDSIEAASRTVDSPDRRHLEDMVRRIVFSKLAEEQLDESGLSLKELRVVCSRVVETLVHMNHHRIKYPWQEEDARKFGLGAQEFSSGPQKSYPRAVRGGE